MGASTPCCWGEAHEHIDFGHQAYEELLDKFSGSSSLLAEYAQFCDVVLNDETKAETFRDRAALLETASGDNFTVAGCPCLNILAGQTIPGMVGCHCWQQLLRSSMVASPCKTTRRTFSVISFIL